MSGRLYRNVASQSILVYAYTESTSAPAVGEANNITAVISLDDAASSATNDVNPTELNATTRKGFYRFDLTPGETNANNTVDLTATCATAGISVITDGGRHYTYPPNLFDTTLPTSPTADTILAAMKRASVGVPQSPPGASGGLALYDDLIQIVNSGTLVTVTSNTVFTVSSGFTTTDGDYVDSFVAVRLASGLVTYSVVTAYTGAIREMTVSPALKGSPANGDAIFVLGLNT